jgi:hypothetical protein
MTHRYAVRLPIIVGLVITPLMVWDIHNQRVIQSMGMAWDTGAPVWPYQTAEILFFFINLPAFVPSIPVAKILHLWVPRHYAVLFPAAVLWWFIIGSIVDGRATAFIRRSKRLANVVLALVAVIFACCGIAVCRHFLQWRATYPDADFYADTLVMLRLLAPAVWSFFLATMATAGVFGVPERRRSPYGS